MSLRGPLRAEIGRYRKRKQISLDGRVAGIEYGRYRRGYDNPAGLSQPSAFHRADGGYLDARLPDDYEPHPGFMERTGPDYAPQADELPDHFQPTPEMRFEMPVERAPDQISYEDSVIVHEMIHRILYDATDTPVEPSGLDPVEQGTVEQLNAESHADISDAMRDGVPQDLVGMTQELFDQQMTELASPTSVSEPEQLPEDYTMQQQELFDERMQQLFNPWMMPGMGPMM